jgi:hypothetical protein
VVAVPSPRWVRNGKENRTMPIILWLLGVPVSIVILLMLFGVVGF